MAISKKKRTVAQILAAAADLITGKGFTKQAFARGKSGHAVDERSRYATCYCTLGAIACAAGTDAFGGDQRYNEARHFVRDVLRGRGIQTGIPSWNDGFNTTQDDVVSVLREAAKVAEGAQA